MANETIASIVAFQQPKRAKSGTKRTRAQKQRKRQKAPADTEAAPEADSPSSETLIPAEFSSADAAFDEPLVNPPAPVAPHTATAPSRPRVASILLVAAALALAGVGLTTVAQPLEEMARTGLQLLLDRVGGADEPPRNVVLEPRLVVRTTTGRGAR